MRRWWVGGVGGALPSCLGEMARAEGGLARAEERKGGAGCPLRVVGSD